jgi:TetR/AcrR family transcriptional repressor of nem operon
MSTPRGQETRERIVRAAAELFRLHGYYHTSVDDILRDSGAKKGNFYFHFKTKEEVGYAVLEWFAKDFGDLFTTTTGGKSTLREQIQAFFGAMEEYQLRNQCQGGCPFGNFALEMGDNHRGFAEHVDTVFRFFESGITRLVEAAKERGEIRPDVESKKTAQFILSAFEGATLLTKVRKEIGVFHNCLESVDNFLRSLQPTPQGLVA